MTSTLICLAFLIGSAPERSDIQMIVKDTNKGGYIIARMRSVSDASFTLTVDCQNLSPNRKLPLQVVLYGEGDHELLELNPVNSRLPWSSTFDYDWTVGHASRRPPRTYEYRLPYKRRWCMVAQGPHGSFSHGAGSENEEAIDFAMPEGTNICAARAGVVIGIRAECVIGGPDPKYERDYNYVTIRQDDGTYAEYAHCKYHGILVKDGQRVAEGQAIALSGNTGYTDGPHLHFDVYRIDNESHYITLPLTFKSSSGKPFKPVEGKTYWSN